MSNTSGAQLESHTHNGLVELRARLCRVDKDAAQLGLMPDFRAELCVDALGIVPGDLEPDDFGGFGGSHEGCVCACLLRQERPRAGVISSIPTPISTRAPLCTLCLYPQRLPVEPTDSTYRLWKSFLLLPVTWTS